MVPNKNVTEKRASKNSGVLKRSIVLTGHKTSISLEDAFWNSLKEIALDRKLSIAMLIEEIDKGRASANLSSACRLFVLEHFRRRPAL